MSYTAKQLAKSYPGQSQEALVEMLLIDKVLALKSFRQIVFNPRLNVTQKKAIVTEIFAKNLSQNSINFLMFLLEENSLKDFDKILSEFKKILKNNHIALSGTVTTPKPISQDEKEKLEYDLGQKIGTPIVLEIVVNPILIGGVVLKVEDQTFDNSFRYKLSKLK